MKVLISGGSGFLGRALTQSFLADAHQVYILTRGAPVPRGAAPISWDAKTTEGWGTLMNEIDVVIHLSGMSLAAWPWTSSKKRLLHDSRVLPGRALADAVASAQRRPRIFVQQSGINHYGLRGELADESTPAADDFLARLTVEWEASTGSVEALGVRRVVTRTSVVLARGTGLLPLLALPVSLFLGGPLGAGEQSMAWIHIKDWVAAIRYLIEDENARGAYNLVAPTATSNADFTKALAKVLRRPYWLPIPAVWLRIFLGEMSVLILEGRFAHPKRLLDSGFRFQYPGTSEAFRDLYGK